MAGKSCQKTDLRQYAKYNPNGRKLIIIARRHMDTGMKEFKNRWIDREVSMDGIMAPSISSWKGLLYHDLDCGMQNPGIASYFQWTSIKLRLITKWSASSAIHPSLSPSPPPPSGKIRSGAYLQTVGSRY